jgi:hypothetical protein
MDNAVALNQVVAEKRNVLICACLSKDVSAMVVPFQPVVFSSWKRTNYDLILVTTD